MISLTRGGARISLSPRETARMRREFEERHFTRLGRILDKELLAESLALTRKSPFAPLAAEHERYINGLGPADPRINVSLSFLFNDQDFFQTIRAITGCAPIRGFIGRLIRHDPGAGHYLRWHSDAEAGGPDRLVALRINLSPRTFRGGALLFRGAREKNPRSAFRSGVLGEAVIFRATRDSVHCNTEVRGEASKISFSGWFYAANRGGGSMDIPGKAIFSGKSFRHVRGRRFARPG
jgi:2-oxoglutarate-Fe(II)-dependent oxygenase superfamily protein